MNNPPLHEKKPNKLTKKLTDVTTFKISIFLILELIV